MAGPELLATGNKERKEGKAMPQAPVVAPQDWCQGHCQTLRLLKGSS